ncbi:MAG TPA: glutathione S-transferase [Rhodocyclaceae bacterium]|nr:glutathione S-transferase [Rhodocyclaceae bacterium]
MLKLYRFALSGHCHRAELFISLLQLPCELIDVDFAGGQHKRPEFLAMNAFGQIPVLVDGDIAIADSNAILVYLASKHAQGQQVDWLPSDALRQAKVQRWLSVAAGQIIYGPARARLKTVFDAPINVEEAVRISNELLAVMEKELGNTLFLAGQTPTIADVSAYSYIAHAPEGNVSLQPFPHVRAWLARIEALPGFVPMQKSAVGLAA